MVSPVSLVGGKGAGLEWLVENKDLGYTVPRFEIIDTTFYEEYLKNGKQVTERLAARCDELTKKFREKAVAVRSSGILSEDGQNHSGAGIYKTVFIDGDDEEPWTQPGLLKAVLEVYASVDGPRAVQYRKDIGIAQECMAVIIQEIWWGANGVVFSRMPDRKEIIPVSWSNERGAAVQGAKRGVYHCRYKYVTYRLGGGGYRLVFESSDGNSFNATKIEKTLLPLVENIKERYGRECDIEFVMSLPSIHFGDDEDSSLPALVQIRPLHCSTSVKIPFPKKKPILIAEYVMGTGEYIGPWRSTADAENGWVPPEPEHYAYVSSRLEKTVAAEQKGLEHIYLRKGLKARKDYDALTSKKKAIVLTEDSFPGTHALTIAHERGILCVVNRSRPAPPDDFKERNGHDKLDMQIILGVSEELLTKPRFDISMEKVSPYIHIVSDGLKGRVYNATREEAVAFAMKNGLSEPSDERSVLIWNNR